MTAPLVSTEGLVVVVACGQTVVDEPHEPRQDGLAVLGFDGVDDVVVGVRVELHQDLAEDADTRLAWAVNELKMLEIVDDAVDDRLVGGAPSPGFGVPAVQEVLPRDGRPVVHELVSRARNRLVRTSAQVDLLQQVPDRDGLNHAVNQGSGEGEARVVLDTLQGSRDDRDVPESGVLEGFAQ